MQPTSLVASVVILGRLVHPAVVTAQNSAAELLQVARVQVEQLNIKSAIPLLHRALLPQFNASRDERIRAYTLLGIAELSVSATEPLAHEDFHQALLLDPSLRVDTLTDLVDGLVAVVEAERARLLLVTLEIPRDTILPLQSGVFQLAARTNRRAQVSVSIATEAGAIAYSESKPVVGSAILEWGLRMVDGSPVSPGKYKLYLAARDSGGEAALPIQETLVIESMPIDTQPFPSRLEPSVFMPESASVSTGRQPAFLARGLLLGAAAGLLSSLGPGGSNGPDAKSYVVGGAIAVTGIVGFFSEHRVMRSVPVNIEHNRELRQQDTQRREEIARSNARSRATPRLRIRIEGTTQ